ncbi:MAG TPA: putative C-S lyase, partial [Anaerolineaceae bacterium]|nr:putative C-S lyase [Anaerolineaceae bacterium]
QATFLGWLDCSDLGLAESPYEFFLREARIGFNDGITFGPLCADFVRLNFGTTRANLQEVIKRMQTALEAR